MLLARHHLGVLAARTANLVMVVLKCGQVGRSSHRRNASDAVLLGLARCNARSNGLHFILSLLKFFRLKFLKF